MKNPVYINSHGVRLFIGDMLIYRGRNETVDIYDAVEDATSADDLARRINNLSVLNKFTVDRVTAEYARLKSVDRLGNVRYLKAYF